METLWNTEGNFWILRHLYVLNGKQGPVVFCSVSSVSVESKTVKHKRFKKDSYLKNYRAEK